MKRIKIGSNDPKKKETKMVKIKKSQEMILDEKKEEKQKIQKEETIIDHNTALKNFLNRVEISDAIVYKNLRLFPINIISSLTDKSATYKLLTLTEALKNNILEVKETDVVANLKFINKSKDVKILLVEGEVVKGGRQNRVINVTMILDENSETVVPTSCVEQHRWSGGKEFDSDVYITPTLYKNLSNSVGKSMYCSRRDDSMVSYHSDQSSLWGAADTFLCSAHTHSGSNDFTKAYESREEDINDYFNKLKPMFKDCAGIAAVIGKKIIFSIADSKEFFMPQFEKLLKSYILEALTAGETIKLSLEKVAQHLDDLLNAKNELYDSPNKIGKIIKFNISKITGSAFMFDGKIVHLSVIKELV
jgi:hypothetical protein